MPGERWLTFLALDAEARKRAWPHGRSAFGKRPPDVPDELLEELELVGRSVERAVATVTGWPPLRSNSPPPSDDSTDTYASFIIADRWQHAYLWLDRTDLALGWFWTIAPDLATWSFAIRRPPIDPLRTGPPGMASLLILRRIDTDTGGLVRRGLAAGGERDVLALLDEEEEDDGPERRLARLDGGGSGGGVGGADAAGGGDAGGDADPRLRDPAVPSRRPRRHAQTDRSLRPDDRRRSG